MSDFSRKLQAAVLEALSPMERWKLNEREAEELLRFCPDYAAVYWKRKFPVKAKP
ncbi:MAG: hypothetical protein JXD23_07475 [Spirochaetales bacterium]|nr:hypothetical protein [Spirochaetales bacterium]